MMDGIVDIGIIQVIYIFSKSGCFLVLSRVPLISQLCPTFGGETNAKDFIVRTTGLSNDLYDQHRKMITKRTSTVQQSITIINTVTKKGVLSIPDFRNQKLKRNQPAHLSKINQIFSISGTPHAYMRSLLNDYLVGARYSLPVHIYNAQCLIYDVVTVVNKEDNIKKQQKGKAKKV